MAVRTGYTKAEIERRGDALCAAAKALAATLPQAPLGQLRLVCSCDRCIDAPALRAITTTPPARWTRDLVSQYFGGAGAVAAQDGPEERAEAWAVLVHTIALLAEGIALSGDAQRDFIRSNYFIEPEHWTMNLLQTGVIAAQPQGPADDLQAILTECASLSAAKGGRLLRDSLTFLALTGDGLGPFLTSLQSLPPRRQLRFWTTFVGWIDHSPIPRYPVHGVDLHNHFFAMPVAGREALCDALEDPATERLIERYAFAAKDASWARYLSRLLEWREATLLSTKWSDRATQTLLDRR